MAGDVDGVRVRAGGTMRAVAGEGFHDVDLVVMGKAAVGGRYGRKAGLADGGRHGFGGTGWFGERPFGDGR